MRHIMPEREKEMQLIVKLAILTKKALVAAIIFILIHSILIFLFPTLQKSIPLASAHQL